MTILCLKLDVIWERIFVCPAMTLDVLRGSVEPKNLAIEVGLSSLLDVLGR